MGKRRQIIIAVVLWVLFLSVSAVNAAKFRIIFTNFTAGELSPFLGARTDFKKYANGCETLENFVVYPHGPVTKRPGFRYVADAKYPGYPVRIIPFKYSTADNYMVELGHKYMRFYTNNGQVIGSGNTNYAINSTFENGVTGWLDADVGKLLNASGSTIYHSGSGQGTGLCTGVTWSSAATGYGVMTAAQYLKPGTQYNYSYYVKSGTTVVGSGVSVSIMDMSLGTLQGQTSGNTSFEVDATKWTALNSAIFDRVTDFAKDGAYSGKLLFSANAASGVSVQISSATSDFRMPYNVKFFVLPPDGMQRIRIRVVENGSGATVYHDENIDGLNAGEWNCIERNVFCWTDYTLPPAAGWEPTARLEILKHPESATSDYVYIDKISAYPTDLFKAGGNNNFNSPISQKWYTPSLSWELKDGSFRTGTTCTAVAFLFSKGDAALGSETSLYIDGISVKETTEPLEIKTVYSQSDIPKIQYTQSADVMILTHPSYPIQYLQRTSTGGGWGDLCSSGTPLTLGDEAGLPASYAFDNNDGSRWGSVGNITADTTYLGYHLPAAHIINRIRVLPNGGGYEPINVKIQYSDNGAAWTTINTAAFPNTGGVYGTITFTNTTQSHAYWRMLAADNVANHWYVYKVEMYEDNYISTPSFGVSPYTLSGVSSTFSDLNTGVSNYPACCLFHENRLVFARTTNNPIDIWLSKDGDFDNFTASGLATDAINISLASDEINQIQWLRSMDSIIVGTSMGEWRVGPVDSNEPITPDNVAAKRQTTIGCADMMAYTLSNNIFFVQYYRKKLYKLSYNWESASYIAPEMSVLAEHITKSGITDMAFQRQPHAIMWTALDNGELAGMTFLEEHDVVAWHQHPVDYGKIKYVGVIPGAAEDQLWACWQRDRVIDESGTTTTKRSIEYLENFFDTTDLSRAYFVDSAFTLTISSNSCTGVSAPFLWYMAGKPVKVLIDGTTVESTTVGTDGSLKTITPARKSITVGYPYSAKVKTMRPEVQMSTGSIQGKPKTYTNAALRLYQSWGGKIGETFSSMRDLVYKKPDEASAISGATVFSGDLSPFALRGGSNRDGYIAISNDDPYPFTLLGIMVDMEVE